MLYACQLLTASRETDSIRSGALSFLYLVQSVFMLAVVVVHDALATEGFGFLSVLARADGVELSAGAVLKASLLPRRLGLQLLNIWLVWPARYSHQQYRENNQRQ